MSPIAGGKTARNCVAEAAKAFGRVLEVVAGNRNAWGVPPSGTRIVPRDVQSFSACRWHSSGSDSAR